MIRLTVPPDLTPGERYGLDVLLDLSRLLIVDERSADVVRLTVTNATPSPLDQALLLGAPLELEDGVVHIRRDTLCHVTALAGGGVEQESTASDRHGRVPSSENPLVRVGREREPVVHQWAVQLRDAVRKAAGRRAVRLLAPWPGGRRWAAAVTHDLDIVARWPVFTLLRSQELARKGEWMRVTQSLAAAFRAIGRDPVAAGVQALLRIERDAGIHSTWFVMSGAPTLSSWTDGDVTYALESARVRRLLAAVQAEGHEIGLHGSFRTALDLSRLNVERERLAKVIGAPPAGIRQHFLKMRPGHTQALMEAAGFSYDATWGFPDRNGFRIGAADVLPTWGVHSVVALDLVPLVWMDRALSKYRGIENPDLWIADGLDLAAVTRGVDGLWVGVWHPNLTAPLGFPGAPEAFRSLLQTLVSHDPFFGTLVELVSWRRARRATRAIRVASDGRVELTTAEPARWPVALEDERGRALSHAPGLAARG